MEVDAVVSGALGAPETALRAVLDALVAEVGVERSQAMLLAAASELKPAPDLGLVARAVDAAADLESLTRPLLEALHDVTGMASTYLTVVHEQQDVQEIRYSLNTVDGFALPEGLEVPWADTLCKRALTEGRACTTNVPEVWGDSDAARDLRIQTYVSVPVRLADGTLWGTLCGADSRPVAEAERHLPTLGMFARLIATEVQRAAALAEAQRLAEVDPLTGCATRHGIDLWLKAAASTPCDVIAAVFVDLDGFKGINDRYGHAEGDAVLRSVGEQLRARRRDGDLVGRVGGDEFVVAAALKQGCVDAFVERWGSQVELTVTVAGLPTQVRGSVGSAVVAPHEVHDLLSLADRAMYEVKLSRPRS
jgi:diguanylate cyclase